MPYQGIYNTDVWNEKKWENFQVNLCNNTLKFHIIVYLDENDCNII